MIMELRQHYKTKYENPELVIKYKLLCEETQRLMFKNAMTFAKKTFSTNSCWVYDFQNTIYDFLMP